MAETAEFPSVARAQELLQQGRSTLDGMRESKASLGGADDPRVAIQRRLAALSPQLTVPAVIQQTPEGRAALESIAREVGQQLSITAPTVVETQPNPSSSFLTMIREWFGK
ncbi:MAG: hypothetical protein WBO77_03960 [Microgenomates group bacterium]